MPAMPSSPHRKARERAISCVKSMNIISQSCSSGPTALTAPCVTIVAVVGLAEIGVGSMELTNSLRGLGHVSTECKNQIEGWKD